MAKAKTTNIESPISLNIDARSIRQNVYSSPSLKQVQGYILEEARQELRWPNSIKLYKQMLLDPNIASAVSLIELILSRLEWEIRVPADASTKEKKRCEQLNYNLEVMERPFQEYIIEILSYISFGFSTPEKIYKEFDKTLVGSFIGWKDFRMISQDTVGQWIFDSESGSLVGFLQDLTNISNSGNLLSRSNSSGKIPVPREKFMLFRHGAKRDNPEGTSPLRSCYTSWKYRSIIEEYETIGVTKDLGGIPVIGIDAAYLSKATQNPSGEEAAVVEELKLQGANLHAAEQSYAIVPISYDASGKELFRFDLKGVDGGGKQYNTDAIVKRHDTKILMAFFADILKLGSDSHGSFSLADTKTSLLAMSLESHLKNIQRTFNHDLIRQTYLLNEWEYNPATSCKFVYSDIEDKDLNLLSSALQRVAATGLIRATSDIEDKIRKDWLNLPPIEEANPEFLKTKVTSRSGDGMEEGLNNGVGDSTSAGGDRSVSNKSNSTS